MNIENVKDSILLALLPDVVFDGWSWKGAENAAVKAGFDKTMARAVFPGGLKDVISHFSDWTDREMLIRLSSLDIAPMRVRDRIKHAVMVRLDVLTPYKDAARQAAAYWSWPVRSLQGSKVMWRTADKIWIWAGDEATDYNRYTKRGLLCGVLGATMLAWIESESREPEAIEPFLDRRIENVMQLGRTLGKLKKAS